MERACSCDSNSSLHRKPHLRFWDFLICPSFRMSFTNGNTAVVQPMRLGHDQLSECEWLLWPDTTSVHSSARSSASQVFECRKFYHIRVEPAIYTSIPLCDHVLLVYSLRSLHFPPYLITRTGTGARTRHNAASTVMPHPQPSFSANGAAASGRKVPIRHRMISTAVIAEAE